MGLEAGNFISDLDQTWPVGGDGLVQGDDHLRLVKKVLKQQFPGADGQGYNQVISTTENELNFSSGVTSSIQGQLNALAALIQANTVGIVPVGGIIIFNGAFVSMPIDYQLCDGTNGTPDMTDRFIYGTNTEAQVGTTGGSADSVNVSHNHIFNGNVMASHSHGIDTRNIMATAGGGAEVPNEAGGITGNQQTGNTSAGTPSGTVLSSGISGVGLNIPPYIRLAYIQRMS